MNQHLTYGQGDATYLAVGEEAGVRALVKRFYSLMSSQPQYQTIRSWHPDELLESEDKLALFLCSWMGGPRLYRSKYGSINIIQAHKHLSVTVAERDQWLNCMSEALVQLNYPDDLVAYLLVQLRHPAERIRQTCTGSIE